MKSSTLVRKTYLDEIDNASGNDSIVKVITGMRGVGKTTIMEQYVSQYIQKHKIKVIDYDFDEEQGLTIRNAVELKNNLLNACEGPGKKVIILHEVQKMQGWSTVIADLVSQDIGEFFITSSDDGVLALRDFESLKDKVVEIRVSPLTLREFMELNKLRSVKSAMEAYLTIGGMPCVRANMSEQLATQLLRGVFHTAILKDVLPYGKNLPAQSTYNLARTLLSNSGTVQNADSVADASGSSFRRTAPVLEALKGCYMIFENEGRTFMSRLTHKDMVFYAADIGIRNCVSCMPAEKMRLGENLLMIELKRLGYSVNIEKDDDDTMFLASDDYGSITYTVCTDTPKERDSCSHVTITMDEDDDTGFISLGRFLYQKEE